MDKYKIFYDWMLEIDNGSGEKYCKDLRELVTFVYTSDPKAPLNYRMCKKFCEANDLDYGQFINFIVYSPHIKRMRGEAAAMIQCMEVQAAKAYTKYQQGW